jgi:drug/metabolite transporter (DMT)-like permease
MHDPATRRGVIAMSIAMGLFITNDALVKLASTSLPGPQLICIRGLFASALMLIVCQTLGAFKRDKATGELPVMQLLNGRLLFRATLDAAASMVYLTALFHLPLPNATAINSATPMIIILMAVVAFKEKVGLGRWLAIVAGFVGVLLIVQPAAAGFNSWALLALFGTLLHSGRDLMTRVIPPRIPSLIITLSTVLAVCLLSGTISLFQGWQPVNARHLALLGSASVLLSAAYFLLIGAMREGDISIVSPFRYTALLFALALGWLLWGDVPNPMAMAGIVLLVAAGLFVLTHGRQRPSAVLDAAPD